MEILRSLDDCVGVAAAGRKAETLARLRAAGLPVLPGLVALPGIAIDDAAALAAEVRARLPGAARLVVRSSSAVEDLPGATAAGVFVSEVGVAVDDVAAAIARVRASADDEPARAYLARAGRARADMAVLVQPLATAPRLGVARRLDDGRFLVEERAAGEPEWGDVAARVIDPPPTLAATAALVAPALHSGGVDVEYARDGEEFTILQARATPPVAAASSERAFVVAEGGDWVLDVEHNPRPLSPAQAGLVALVDAAGLGARQRVLGGGWLYVSRSATPRATAPIAPADLRATFDAVIAPDCDAALARAEADGSLEAALEAYLHVYRRYVDEVGPSLRAARVALDRALGDAVGEPLAAHGALLGGLGGLTAARDALLYAIGTTVDATARAAHEAEYAARFGAYAPAWDVAVPCDDESPARVAEMAAAWAARGRSPSELQAEAAARARAAADALAARVADSSALRARLDAARAALPVAEDDDRLFFRAQRAVRRALLATGAWLAEAGHLARPDDVFWLTLDEARAAELVSPPVALRGLSAIARANRHAWEAAARIVAPRALVDGRPLAEAPPMARAVLRGHPTAGRARGRAVVVSDPAAAPTTLPDDAVLVVPALLPSLSYLLPQARALVTAHGGATSHGATLAREYGLPAVLGVGRAPPIPDGAPLLVDAATGRVYLL